MLVETSRGKLTNTSHVWEFRLRMIVIADCQVIFGVNGPVRDAFIATRRVLHPRWFINILTAGHAAPVGVLLII